VAWLFGWLHVGLLSSEPIAFFFKRKCKNELNCEKFEGNKVVGTDGKCTDSCSDGSVNIQGKCTICQTDEKCKKCSEKDLSICVLCKQNFYLLNGKCDTDCPSGYFKKNGDTVFGKELFKFPRKYPRRIVFQYSSEVVMSLKYYDDKQMIVFDHLSPKDAFMEGQYQYYGPDFSYDGFTYHKDKWKYIEDIDIKNIKSKNDNVRHKENKKDKPIYVPH
jgi:hypothetical protein